jgi:hypothetical protein
MTLSTRFSKRAFAVLACSLCLLASSARAEWLYVGRTDEFRAYLDSQSLRKNGDMVQVVQLTDFATAQWADARTVIGSLKSLVEYDCHQARSRTLALEAYSEQMSEGVKVAAERIPDPQWEAVVPGSSNEDILRMVCGR